MKKFLPPLCLTLDNTFKVFFKHDQDLLKPLLQDFLPLPPGCRVEHVQLLDTEENSSEASKPSGKTLHLGHETSHLSTIVQWGVGRK